MPVPLAWDELISDLEIRTLFNLPEISKCQTDMSNSPSNYVCNGPMIMAFLDNNHSSEPIPVKTMLKMLQTSNRMALY